MKRLVLAAYVVVACNAQFEQDVAESANGPGRHSKWISNSPKPPRNRTKKTLSNVEREKMLDDAATAQNLTKTDAVDSQQESSEIQRNQSVLEQGDAPENWVQSASGLKYLDVVEGSGPTPTKGETVYVHYTGRLQKTGKEFDSSIPRGKPLEFKVGTGQVIAGWDEGILTMKAGGKRRLIIPPDLGYGAQGAAGGRIPPQATLAFDCELVSIGKKKKISKKKKLAMAENSAKSGAADAKEELGKIKELYKARPEAEIEDGLKHRGSGVDAVKAGIAKLEKSEQDIKQRQADIKKQLEELEKLSQKTDATKEELQSVLAGSSDVEKSSVSLVETANQQIYNGTRDQTIGQFQAMDAMGQGGAAVLSAHEKKVARAMSMASKLQAQLSIALEKGIAYKNDKAIQQLVQLLIVLPDVRRPVAKELLKVMKSPAYRRTEAVQLQKQKMEQKMLYNLQSKAFTKNFIQAIRRDMDWRTVIRRKVGARSDKEWLVLDTLNGGDHKLQGAFFDSEDPAVVFHKLLAPKSLRELGQDEQIKDVDVDQAVDSEANVPVTTIAAPCMLYQLVRHEHVIQKSCDLPETLIEQEYTQCNAHVGPNIEAQCQAQEREILAGGFFHSAYQNCRFPVPLTEMFQRTDVDHNVSPGKDFNLHANGNWMWANPLPYGLPYYDDNMVLMQRNEGRIASILDSIEAMPPTMLNNDHDIENVRSLYQDAQDNNALDSAGNLPIQPILAVVAGMTSKNKMESLASLFYDWGITAFIQMGTAPDEHDSSMSYLAIAPNQDAVLPANVYEPDEDDKDFRELVKIKNAYLQTIHILLELGGVSAEDSSMSWARMAFKLEGELAKLDEETNYKETGVDEEPELVFAEQWDERLKEEGDADRFWQWQEFFQHLGKPMQKLGKIRLMGSKAIKAVSKHLSRQPIANIKAFLAWQVVKTYAPYMDRSMRKAYNDFFGKILLGHDAEPAPKERAQMLVESVLGSEVGMLYGKKYFTPEIKIWAMDMVKNLIGALRTNINAANWITTNKTREGALLKADNFLIKLGMPEETPDHSGLFMIPGSLVESIVNAHRFYFSRMLDESNAPTDFTEWSMTPQTVNAYYNPRFNEFVIPAGIFQPPFFDARSSAALNYGSIGAVIGHEMTHSIDPEGRKYNWKGNREDWSAPADSMEFERIANDFADQAHHYKSYGVPLKGFQERNEIVADNGGLQLAYDALKEYKGDFNLACFDGFTEEKRFWYSWARTWAASTTKAFIEKQVMEDVHPPADFRINKVVSNFKAWKETFEVSKKDALYLPNHKQVNVWPQDETKFDHGSIKKKRTPMTKRGVRQPRTSTDCQPNPGKPTDDNGRKTQGVKKNKQESCDVYSSTAQWPPKKSEQPKKDKTTTKKPLVREQPEKAEVSEEMVPQPIGVPPQSENDSTWLRTSLFTLAFSIFQIVMAFVYQALKRDSSTTPYDGGVHNVAMMQKGEFRYGIFDCAQVPSLTVFSLICCPVRWADTTRMAGFLMFWTGALIMIALNAASPLTSGLTLGGAWLTALMYRLKLRQEFQIPITPKTVGEDLVSYMFCPCLAVVQEARQMEEAYAVGHPIKTVVLREWAK